MAQLLVALYELLRHSRLDERLEFLVVGSRDSIPELRRSAMVEIDTGHVEVFHMPREYGSESTDIKIRRVDSGKCSLSQCITF